VIKFIAALTLNVSICFVMGADFEKEIEYPNEASSFWKIIGVAPCC